jgi:hypothetical protein
MIELTSDMMKFILELLSYLVEAEELHIYFTNSNKVSQEYIFKGTSKDYFVFYPTPKFSFNLHASLVKYIMPPSTSIEKIYVQLMTFSSDIYFNYDLDKNNIKEIQKIFEIRMEYPDFEETHTLLNHLIFHGEGEENKQFKSLIKNMNKGKYELLKRSKADQENSIKQYKTMLENPYLNIDRELVKTLLERTKNRLKFINMAISEAEKVSYPDKKIPEEVYKLEKQFCQEINYISRARMSSIIETLILGGCVKNNISTRNLQYAWEDLKKIIEEIYANVKTRQLYIPYAVAIYDELINKVKKCYYSAASSNFLVDFYNLGSCNCQCGTYMLYHLFQMFHDDKLHVFAKLERGHIKISGALKSSDNTRTVFYDIETTKVASYFDEIADTRNYINDAQCFIYSPFVLSCAFIQFEVTDSHNNLYERMVRLPLWDEKYFSDLESYFNMIDISGANTLADIDSLFVLTIYNVIKYAPEHGVLLVSYVERIRPHFYSDISRIVDRQIDTEEMLRDRKKENINIFSQMKTEYFLRKAPYKSGEESIQPDKEAEGDYKSVSLKLREKIREKKKERT